MNKIIDWLANSWFKSHCDGEWEHEFQIKIETLDNPGWSVSIDLCDTELENKYFEPILFNNNPDDWLICKAENNIFQADGDIGKLETILSLFKSWAEFNLS